MKTILITDDSESMRALLSVTLEKPLGKLYQNIDIMSGATILGDGSIALVMDTAQMVKKYLKKEEQTI